MNLSPKKIALGTVQFGVPYGIANTTGLVPVSEVEKILELSLSFGIEVLDTAINYGRSETILGQIGVERWKIISKLPSIPEGCVDILGWVRMEVEQSLLRLRVSMLHGLLLHNPSDLVGTNSSSLISALMNLKSAGLVEKIGISVYRPNEIEAAKVVSSLDIVQAPLNLIDQRLVRSGWLDKLANDGTDIYVRSAFLQGLLLMDPASRPPYFSRWNDLLGRWDNWLSVNKMSAIDACLAYCFQFPGIQNVILGIDSVSQMQGILESLNHHKSKFPDFMFLDDPMLIEPFNWSRGL